MNRFLPLLCLLVVSALFGTIGAYTGAKAETAPTVLTDLQKDANFDATAYPVIESDYSLQVIQIAESTDGELLVYVYVPSVKLEATSINISTAINDSLHYVNYPLRLVDSAETLHKYRVGNFAVKPDALRYYDISAIYRKFNEAIDEKPTDDNTITEVSYLVGELWTAATVNGAITYTHMTTETVVVTDKHVGFIRYPNGFSLSIRECDSHYVAFTTDKDVNRLMDADVFFVSRGKHYQQSWGSTTTYDDPVSQTVTLSDVETGNYKGNGWFAHEYSWKRIEKVSDFVADKDNNLSDETKRMLANKHWVLRFYESSFEIVTGGGNVSETSTEVTDVTILRLKFETDGVVYNLGAVDNKQSADDKPDNKPPKTFAEKFWEWLERAWNWLIKAWDWIKANWKWIVGGLVGVIVLSFVIKFIRWVLD